MGNNLRAIFFDAGNTLIFPRVEELAADLTAQGYASTVAHFDAAERLGKQRLDAWLWPKIRSRDLPPRADPIYWLEYLRALMDGVGAPAEARDGPREGPRERLVRRCVEGFSQISFWSRVYPGTPSLLENLRAQGYYLGVISNSIGTMEEHLNRVDLARHFDAIFDSAVVGVEKPHPEIFEMALNRSGFKPAEALFVGDIYSSDIGGAELAGMRGVLMDRVGAYEGAECPRIRALPELPGVLERL